MRFRLHLSRPTVRRVTAIEMGDIDRGYKAIDITGKEGGPVQPDLPLYSHDWPSPYRNTPRAN